MSHWDPDRDRLFRQFSKLGIFYNAEGIWLEGEADVESGIIDRIFFTWPSLPSLIEALQDLEKVYDREELRFDQVSPSGRSTDNSLKTEEEQL